MSKRELETANKFYRRAPIQNLQAWRLVGMIEMELALRKAKLRRKLRS